MKEWHEHNANQYTDAMRSWDDDYIEEMEVFINMIDGVNSIDGKERYADRLSRGAARS